MTDQWTDEDRARLARHIAAQMDRLRIDTDAEMIRRTGIAIMTWRKVRRGTGSVATHTYKKIDDVLGWARGSCELILAGREPIPAAPDVQADTDSDAIEAALQQLREQISLIEKMVRQARRPHS